MLYKLTVPFLKNKLVKSVSFTVLSCLVIALFLFNANLLNDFELRTLDYRFTLRGAKPVKSDIAIVFIGNQDIEDIGIWPWRRYYHALLIDALKKHGASQIGFDILFTDLSKVEFKEDDELLALSAKEAGNVSFISFFSYNEELKKRADAIPPNVILRFPSVDNYSLDTPQGKGALFRTATSQTLPITELLKAAQGIGHADCLPDNDGITRRLPLLVGYDGRLYFSFSLTLVCNYLGITKNDIQINLGESIVLKKGDETYTIPINEKGEMIVNFSHQLEDFKAYSYNQLLQSSEFPEASIYNLAELKNKIAVIGTTYTGNTDMRPTPLDTTFPFLCLQATAIDNILQREFIYQPPKILRLLLIIFVCSFVSFLCSYTKPAVNSVIILMAGSLYLYLTFLLFKSYGIWLDVILPLIAFLLPYIIITTIHYIYALFENIKYFERMKYLGNLVESSHDAIFSFDINGNVISWNNGAKLIYGYQLFEVLGKSWQILVPPEKVGDILELIKRVKERKFITNYETNFVVKGGRIIPVNVSISPIVSAKMEVSGVSVISQDLTERKRLMEQIMESEKLAEVGRLSAGIAHEIKNPLTPIIFYAQNLAESVELNPEITHSQAKIIVSEANRILKLATDLLSFSRPKEEITKPISLNDVIDETVLLIVYQVRKLGTEIDKELAENLQKIKGEPDKIKQVLINLVMNAAYAIKEKRGRIKLRTASVMDGNQNFVKVTVEDNGSGMPQEVKDNLFKPFFTTKPKGVGTGLGLYISYNIVKMHGGSISAESKEGEGTTFTLMFPAIKE